MNVVLYLQLYLSQLRAAERKPHVINRVYLGSQAERLRFRQIHLYLFSNSVIELYLV